MSGEMSGEIRHPLFARMYARFAPQMDRRGGERHRRALLAGLNGAVVEVGAGSGLNFAHYPAAVERVVAVEPEPYLRGKAKEAAAGAPVPVEVTAGTAEGIPAPDDAFDAAVCSLVLCSVAEQGRALAEIARVLRPGGELRFYEHVRSPRPRIARLQRAVTTVWRRVNGGCHLDRDTVRAIAAAGFVLERSDTAAFEGARVQEAIAPHVLGVARLPAA